MLILGVGATELSATDSVRKTTDDKPVCVPNDGNTIYWCFGAEDQSTSAR